MKEIALHCSRRRHAPGTRLSTTYYLTTHKQNITSNTVGHSNLCKNLGFKLKS